MISLIGSVFCPFFFFFSEISFSSNSVWGRGDSRRVLLLFSRCSFCAVPDYLCFYILPSLPPFNRFGACRAEICRDHITGDSLNYAFVEFEAVESCEEVSETHPGRAKGCLDKIRRGTEPEGVISRMSSSTACNVYLYLHRV